MTIGVPRNPFPRTLRGVFVCGVLASVPLSTEVAAQQAPPTAATVTGSGANPALTPTPAPAPARMLRSSLFELVELVADAMEIRAAEEQLTGPVRLEATFSRGLNARRGDRAFTSRLRKRLRTGGVLIPRAESKVRARVVLSVEGARVWAVGSLEGGPLPGPTTFAVSRPLDRELELVFGKAFRTGQSRWVLERLGTIPAGVLDVLLTDIDGDLADDLVVLSIDAVRAYRYAPGDARPQLARGPFKLPAAQRWPRAVMGWVADAGDGQVWLATTAGHALLLNVKDGHFTEAPTPGVPLRQTRQNTAEVGAQTVLTTGGYGSPTLRLPLRTTGGKAIDSGNLPRAVRDIVRWPDREASWLWVDDEGKLGGRVDDMRPVAFGSAERAGDRIAAGDLDGDGDLEVVTSAATAPGEADQLTVYRVDPELRSLTVAFRSHLHGGEVAALAIGDLDLDDHPDLLVVEENGTDEALLWRLEHNP